MSNPIGPDHLEAEANRRLLGKPGDNPLEALLRQSAQQWAFERQESTNRKFGWYDCIAKLEAMVAVAIDIDVDTTPLQSLGREYSDGFKSGWRQAMVTVRKAAQQEGR